MIKLISTMKFFFAVCSLKRQCGKGSLSSNEEGCHVPKGKFSVTNLL